MGLKVGDTITAISGAPVNDWYEATQIIQKSPEIPLIFSVLRDGTAQDIRVIPRAVKVDGRIIGQIGAGVQSIGEINVPDDYRMNVTYSPSQAIGLAFNKTYELSKMTLVSMGKMVSGLIGLDNLSGPITIAEVSKDSVEMGLLQVLSTMALISISLAVLNLLPIPVLDGGHLLFYTYELIFGKPMSESVQMTGFKVGFTLLLCFMLLAIGNDIIRVFG